MLKKFALEFELHPIAVEDVVEIQHRPKIDFFGDTLFLVTSIIQKNAVNNRSVLETEQVCILILYFIVPY